MFPKQVPARLAELALLIYRQLLRLYPREFRASYAAGMERMFRDNLGDKCIKRTVGSLALLLLRETWGILRTAPAQRRAYSRTVTPTAGRQPLGVGAVLSTIASDVRFAVRTHLRRPGFALTVVVQLGLGIGATTTILSVVDSVLLRPLPYPDADELVVFSNPGHSMPLYTDWRDRTHSFTAVAAVWNDGRGMGLSGDGDPESLGGAHVSSEFFQMFGAVAIRGRLLVEADYDGALPGVAVISHSLWQRRWGGSWASDIEITVDGKPLVVVGVLDPAFQEPDELMERGVDVWLPLNPPQEVSQLRNWNALRVVARLRPAVTIDDAQSDLNSLARLLSEEYPATDRLPDGSPRLYRLTPLFEAMVAEVEQFLFLLLGAVGMMLLIACANVTNIFLARETGRTRELTLRAALGAGSGRIFSHHLAESLLFALTAGALGIVLTVVGINALELLNPDGFPRTEHIQIDTRALSYSIFLTLGCAVLLAVPPTLASRRSPVATALKTTELGTTEPRKAFTVRKLLVVAELATGLMLLVGANLLFQSFIEVRSVDGGFEADNVLVLPLELGSKFTEERRTQFVQELVQKIGGIPGVDIVAAGTTVPPYGHGRCCWFDHAAAEPDGSEQMLAMLHPITDSYFDALGASILRGESFSTASQEPGQTPTVINETLARRLFGQTSPLGESVFAAGTSWTVVGVVNDIRHWGLRRESGANVYVPHSLYGGPFTSVQVAVRSQADPAGLSAALRETVWAVDSDLPIREISELGQIVARSVAEPRFLSVLMATFAGIAVLLTAGGVYGFLAFAMRQRHREFGIRIALGAKRTHLTRMVLRSVVALTLLGSVAGLAGAFALSRLLGSVLYGVSPTDPTAFITAAFALIVTAIVASYVPIHKASGVDPIETLRIQ